MGRMKQVATDFAEYLEGLEKQDLLALLQDLIKDDELRVRQMWIIMQRAGVEGYASTIAPATVYYTNAEAIAQSIKMGSKGNVGHFVTEGVNYWSDVDTGELWNASLCSCGGLLKDSDTCFNKP